MAHYIQEELFIAVVKPGSAEPPPIAMDEALEALSEEELEALLMQKIATLS